MTALRLLLVAALVAFASPLLAKGRSGGVLPGASARDPVEIDAGKLDYFDKDLRLVYSGGVVVVNGPSTLKASRLVVFLDKEQPGAEGNGGSDRVRHIDADGPVTLVSKDQIGTGDRGAYDRAENKVYLYGNVVLSQGENVSKGDRLVYDIATGQASVLGERVRSVFKPSENKSDGKPKDAPEAEQNARPEKTPPDRAAPKSRAQRRQ